jgi:hypothetical protein
MTLSSTIRTLIGGTVPSSRPAEAGFAGGGGSPFTGFVAETGVGFFFVFFGFWPGRGEEERFGGVIEGLC